MAASAATTAQSLAQTLGRLASRLRYLLLIALGKTKYTKIAIKIR